jgi:hypothetical protein
LGHILQPKTLRIPQPKILRSVAQDLIWPLVEDGRIYLCARANVYRHYGNFEVERYCKRRARGAPGYEKETKHPVSK